MLLLFKEQIEQLLVNGSSENHGKDHIPIVKINLMGTNMSWLLTELNPNDRNAAVGLYQDGDEIKYGEINLELLGALKGPDCRGQVNTTIFTDEELSSPVPVTDITFKGEYPISVYKQVAETIGMIQTNERENEIVWSKYVRQKVNRLLPKR